MRIRNAHSYPGLDAPCGRRCFFISVMSAAITLTACNAPASSSPQHPATAALTSHQQPAKAPPTPVPTSAPAVNPALKEFAGDWRILSERLYYDIGGGTPWSQGGTSQDLHLSADGAWRFGGSTGRWEIQPITANDWTTWRVKPYGPKQKIVVHGWNQSDATGPIEESGQEISFVWIIYHVTPPTVKAPGLVYIKFGHR